MPTFPARRFLSPRRLLVILLLLAVAGIGTWYVHSRGGVANTLQLPPALDTSTPKAQEGFTLLDIQRPGQKQNKYGQAFCGFQYEDVNFQTGYGADAIDTADALGLWIKPPLDSLLNENEMDSGSSTFGKALSVTARLSTGETLPLEWHLRNQGYYLPPGEAAKCLVFTSLPSGYSDACRYVDFTIADQLGHSVHWRISRLPPMRHAVPAPSTITDTVTKEGITMSAQAWHQQIGQPGQIGEIAYLLHPILPPNSHQWDVRITDASQEWEPYDYDGHSRNGISYDSTYGTLINGRNGVFNKGFERRYGGIYGFARNDPYPRMNHSLRLTAELRQFEIYDEPVIFHNIAVQYDPNTYRLDHEKVYYLSLPEPLTTITPSGIAVTLPAQGENFRPTLYGGALNFFVTVQPKLQDTPVAYPLPNSPLARTFGKPVKISLTFPLPYHLSGCSNGGNSTPANYAMSLPPNPAWRFTRKGISISS